MGRAAFLLDLDSFVPLVFCEAAYDDRGFYLGSRHSAAAAHGPTDELRLEIHVADGAAQPRHCGRLAIFTGGCFAMDCLQPSGGRAVCSLWSRVVAGMEVG